MIGIVYGYLVNHGGVGVYLSEILPHISKERFIELLSIENNISIPKNINSTKINCKRDKKFLSIHENLNFSKEIEFNKSRLDILHSHGVYDFCPDIYTAHICLKEYFKKMHKSGNDSELPEDISGIISLEKNIIKNSKIITAVSEKVADEIVENYNIDRNKIQVIKGASRFRGNQKKKKKNNQIVIGFVGGNLRAKGIVTLIESGNILKNKGFDVVVIGAGTNSEIEDYFIKNAKFNFDLKGKVKLTSEFYMNMDIYVCPSIYEAYSLSTLEAMSLGVPVVSSNEIGIFYDNPDEKLARVLDICNADELSETIEKAFNNIEFKQEIIESGKRISLQNSWEDIAESYDKLYSSI